MEKPLREYPADLKLIETFAWPGNTVDAHLARMAASAAECAMPFDRAGAEFALSNLAGTGRCRLTLDRAGEFTAQVTPLAPAAPRWRIAVAHTHLNSGDLWLRHKTTHRARYDADRAAMPAGLDELIYCNERGELCEGTITNLFVILPDGRRVTPALECGLLPGILRAHLLVTGWEESVLSLPDLDGAQVFIGNDLRGLIPADLVAQR